MTERWEEVAQRLEALAGGATEEQRRVATAIGMGLPAGVPAAVAAVLLKAQLSAALMESFGRDSEIPETLTLLEDELGIADRAELHTGSSQEVSAWFAARYTLITANGLRELKPKIGDVVTRADSPSAQMVISSIGDNGCVYMRGGRGMRSWPNHLTLVAREGAATDHASLVVAVDAQIRNSRSDHSPNSPQLSELTEYRLTSHLPSIDAVRELEDLLESGESGEGPFQRLVERHPQLLSSLVIGNWGTYVIPQQRLGAEHVTDFLVLGVNSMGPQWVAVELEAPRHQLLTQQGDLRSEVQHAVNQIQDWRDWLTSNVTYAQTTLHLHGLTNHVAGLVVIGRDQPQVNRRAARSRVAEQQNIQIHSWDWILRQASRLVADGRQSQVRAVGAVGEEWA